MNLRSATATLAIGTALLLAIVAAGWFLLVGPVTEEISAVRTQVEETEGRNDVLAADLRGLEALAADLGQTDRAAGAVKTLWPATAAQPTFFRAVNDAARSAGYAPDDVATLSPSAPLPVTEDGQPLVDPVTGEPTAATPDEEQQAAYAVQTVAIALEGDFGKAERFLAALERMPRSVLVLGVSVESTNDVPLLTVTGATFVSSPVEQPETDDAETSAVAETEEDGSVETDTALPTPQQLLRKAASKAEDTAKGGTP